MSQVDRMCRGIDALNERLGRACAWLVLVLAMLQFAVVLMRYVFGIASVYASESLVYVYAALFMLVAGYTLLHDAHVRIDVLYTRMNRRRRAIVDTLGGIFLLLPSTVFIAWQAFPYVERSWRTLEGSSTMGGLPVVFLLKSLILVFCLVLALQGVSLILRSLRIALDPDDDPARVP